jgi:hypothetical protein
MPPIGILNFEVLNGTINTTILASHRFSVSSALCRVAVGMFENSVAEARNFDCQE